LSFCFNPSIFDVTSSDVLTKVMILDGYMP
jgi:hypothetical protein